MSKVKRFDELGLSEETLKAIVQKGFEEPTPIQAAAIPLLLAGQKDVVGQAQTGTGKTAAFGLPMIEKLKPGSKKVQALILAPVRELAIQISEEINSLKGSKKLRILPVYGGQSIDAQQRRLKQGVDIVVGTPGRVLDLIKRGNLDLQHLSYAVLDEADEMLQMGFIEDIEDILAESNDDKMTMMFSATMPKRIMSTAEGFMREFDVVKVEKQQLTTNLTEQIYFEVKHGDKFDALTRIIDMESDFYGLVFCRTRNDVDDVASHLIDCGYAAEGLHGDVSQAQREKILAKARKKTINILVATDVAARGIDIIDLTHVINYSIPQNPEAYIHRVGRTGRAGKPGTAITFVTPAEYRKLLHIQKASGSDIKKEKAPSVSAVIHAKKNRLKDDIVELITEGAHTDCIKLAKELLFNNEPHDIVAALLKHSFKDDFSTASYGGAAAGQSVDKEGKTRLFIALGKKDGFNPKKLVDFLWEKARVKNRKIQEVNVFDVYSFATVPFADAENIIHIFKGKRPFVEEAQKVDNEKAGSKGFDASENKKKKKKKKTGDFND